LPLVGLFQSKLSHADPGLGEQLQEGREATREPNFVFVAAVNGQVDETAESGPEGIRVWD
jgi:hypothetical protein